MKSTNIAQLNNQLIGWNDELETAIKERDHAAIRMNRCKGKIASIKKKMTIRKKEDPITDHAIVRYLQHIMGVDIKDLKKTIMESDDCHRVMKKGVVVTIKKK